MYRSFVQKLAVRTKAQPTLCSRRSYQTKKEENGRNYRTESTRVYKEQADRVESGKISNQQGNQYIRDSLSKLRQEFETSKDSKVVDR